LERSFGGNVILGELRTAGLRVESHHKRFRHNTWDEIWLTEVGEKKWIVLMRDKGIGKHLLELDALLDGGVKAFVISTKGLKDPESAQLVIKALPKIFDMVTQNNFPFIAKVQKDASVELWKTEPMIHKGIQKKKRR
jgi:PIN domain-containing protein